MKDYPRFYQILTSGNKVINTTNAEFTARKMLKALQTIDKRAKVIVYDRIGVITGDTPITKTSSS